MSRWIGMILCFFLTGCNIALSGRYHYKHDFEPQKHPIDFKKIRNAVPKVEPRSKHGNARHYTVRGKGYQVRSSSKGYDKTGVASWYGMKFHNNLTSSGEPYNMYAMTAANKELPLPTYVFVENLSNGKRIIVKINDRGPFHEDRIIDLSYAAAMKLGMRQDGTALVRVVAIDPIQYQIDQKYPHLKQNSPPKLYIQVGSYRRQQNAILHKKQLERIIKDKVIISHQGSYRVRIGPIDTVDHADVIESLLKIHKIKSYMVVA